MAAYEDGGVTEAETVGGLTSKEGSPDSAGTRDSETPTREVTLPRADRKHLVSLFLFFESEKSIHVHSLRPLDSSIISNKKCHSLSREKHARKIRVDLALILPQEYISMSHR